MRIGIIVALLLAAGAFAQERDFLTADEIDQVRDAQEPNLRLKLYVHFARQRISEIAAIPEQGQGGPFGADSRRLGRVLHSIIDAIDTVADDALVRKVAIDEGMKAVAAAEGEMLARSRRSRIPIRRIWRASISS